MSSKYDLICEDCQKVLGEIYFKEDGKSKPQKSGTVCDDCAKTRKQNKE